MSSRSCLEPGARRCFAAERVRSLRAPLAARPCRSPSNPVGAIALCVHAQCLGGASPAGLPRSSKNITSAPGCPRPRAAHSSASSKRLELIMIARCFAGSKRASSFPRSRRGSRRIRCWPSTGITSGRSGRPFAVLLVARPRLAHRGGADGLRRQPRRHDRGRPTPHLHRRARPDARRAWRSSPLVARPVVSTASRPDQEPDHPGSLSPSACAGRRTATCCAKLGFFQNDFAGRVANKVMQAAPAVRESVVQVIDAIWYVGRPIGRRGW